MKRIVIRISGVLLFVLSVLLLCYPFISNYLMENAQETEVTSYENAIKNKSEDEMNKIYEEAVEYNQTFLSTVVITDPFDPNFKPPKDFRYENLLNFGNGLMGYVEIPAIDVRLPIYHGTSDDTLTVGAGHLQNTSLPVGGTSSHSVITGHTGLSSAKLFSDLDQVKRGDCFYIKTLDKVLAYQVDKISVVKPNNTSSLHVVEGEDYVTLVTCTPYGINSHRLLVRGKRISYTPEQQAQENEKKGTVESTWMREYRRALIGGAIIFSVVIVIFLIIRRIYKRRKQRIKKRSEG